MPPGIGIALTGLFEQNVVAIGQGLVGAQVTDGQHHRHQPGCHNGQHDQGAEGAAPAECALKPRSVLQFQGQYRNEQQGGQKANPFGNNAKPHKGPGHEIPTPGRLHEKMPDQTVTGHHDPAGHHGINLGSLGLNQELGCHHQQQCGNGAGALVPQACAQIEHQAQG